MLRKASRSYPVLELPAMPGMLGIRGSRAAVRKVRIHLPPAESLSLAGLYLPGREPRLSTRVSGLRSRRGRQRAPRPASSAPIWGNISGGLYSSTPFPTMRSRQVVGLKSQGSFPMRDRTFFGSRMLVDVASVGLRSSKAERGPLVVPGKRQAGVREQLLCRQTLRWREMDRTSGSACDASAA